MKRTYNLEDSIDRMKFRELMLPNWCQKKYRAFREQLEEYAPHCDGETDLLLGLCYQHGWGVWKNKETARTYFSRLTPGKTVWFGHYVSFMECDVIKVEQDRVLLRTKDPRFMYVGYGHDLMFPPPEAAPWDRCLARKWMNSHFFENSFYKQERELILKVKITTPPNPYTGVQGSEKECVDRVFPLSLQEYMEYKGWTGRIPTVESIIASTKGPENVAVRAGHFVTRIVERTKKYPLLNFGYNWDGLIGTNPRTIQGAFFRTPGNSPDSKAFEIMGLIFHEGETKSKTLNNTELGYHPAFWVSLK